MNRIDIFCVFLVEEILIDLWTHLVPVVTMIHDDIGASVEEGVDNFDWYFIVISIYILKKWNSMQKLIPSFSCKFDWKLSLFSKLEHSKRINLAFLVWCIWQQIQLLECTFDHKKNYWSFTITILKYILESN